MWLVAGVLLVVLSALGGVLLFSSTDDRVEVVVAATELLPGPAARANRPACRSRGRGRRHHHRHARGGRRPRRSASDRPRAGRDAAQPRHVRRRATARARGGRVRRGARSRRGTAVGAADRHAGRAAQRRVIRSVVASATTGPGRGRDGNASRATSHRSRRRSGPARCGPSSRSPPVSCGSRSASTAKSVWRRRLPLRRTRCASCSSGAPSDRHRDRIGRRCARRDPSRRRARRGLAGGRNAASRGRGRSRRRTARRRTRRGRRTRVDGACSRRPLGADDAGRPPRAGRDGCRRLVRRRRSTVRRASAFGARPCRVVAGRRHAS